MFRLGQEIDGQWRAWSHPPRFCEEKTDTGQPRLVAGLPGSDPDVFFRLARTLEAPLRLLYVLHTPRGEAKPGRYESAELSHREVEGFGLHFRRFLAADGRFDLWVHSPSEHATVVWDRHDLLFLYGPLDSFASELRAMGFDPGNPGIPSPHAHHYHPEMDVLARDLMSHWKWRHKPLQPGDEQ